MKKFKWGITSKMLISILIPTALVMIAIIGITYWQSRQVVDEQMQYGVQQQALQSAAVLQSRLKESEVSLKMTAHILNSQQERSEKDLLTILQTVKDNNPDFLDVLVGYDNGKIVDALNTPALATVDARSLPWYKAVTSDAIVYLDLHENQATKKVALTVAYPLKSGGKRIGVIAAEISQEKLAEVVSAVKVGQQGYAFAIDHGGHYIFHPTNQPLQDIFTIANGAYVKDGNLYLSGKPQVSQTTFNGVRKVLASAPVGNTGMALTLGTSVAEFESGINRLVSFIVILSLLGLMILFSIIFLVVRKNTRIMGILSNRVSELAAGDFSVEKKINLQLADDELGELHHSINTMFVNTRSLLTNIQETSELVASSSEQLTASVEESTEAIHAVASAIDQVAQDTEKQRQAMNDVSQDMVRRDKAINQMAEKAGAVSQASQQAAEKAHTGATAVEQAVNQMSTIEQSVTESANVVSKLGERSKEIGQIVETISGIAGQTNLLALNAAIEAARAGEQGRGFAVVADEVRKLAEQSQEAAKQIGHLIGEIQSETSRAVATMEAGTKEVQTGSQVVQASGLTFREIIDVVQNVTSQIQEISVAVEELAAGGTQTNVAVQELEAIITDTANQTMSVSTTTTQQTESINEISSSSQSLANVAEKLRQAIAKFTL